MTDEEKVSFYLLNQTNTFKPNWHYCDRDVGDQDYNDLGLSVESGTKTNILFYFILLYFILFYFVLFHFIFQFHSKCSNKVWRH